MQPSIFNTTLHNLHNRAQTMRNEVFGRRVFVRGVVEVSSYCRQNCSYSGMRRDNRELTRYRMAADELAELIIHHRPASITDIDIQAGENPVVVREVVMPLVRELRSRTNLGITLCLGTLTPSMYDQLHSAGADFYVMKIETGNAEHYRDIRAPGRLSERVKAIRYLTGSGWNVSSGLILGLPGQTEEILEQTLNLLTLLPLAGCSVNPFVAGGRTPYKDECDGDIEQTLNCVAWMRLHAPHWIIPAVSAMGLVSKGGYVRALLAGANLTTINFTPTEARDHYSIYKHDRIIMDEERVLSAIQEAGCEVSPVGISDYLKDTADTMVLKSS